MIIFYIILWYLAGSISLTWAMYTEKGRIYGHELVLAFTIGGALGAISLCIAVACIFTEHPPKWWNQPIEINDVKKWFKGDKK